MTLRTRLQCVMELDVEMEDTDPHRASESTALTEEAGIECLDPLEEITSLLAGHILEAARHSASRLGIRLHSASITAVPGQCNGEGVKPTVAVVIRET